MAADEDPPTEEADQEDNEVGARKVSDEEFEASLEKSLEKHDWILRELAKR